MIIYNKKFNGNAPSTQRIVVNTGSDWMVGLEVEINEQTIDLSGDVKIMDGSTEIQPTRIDGTKAMFKLSSDNIPGNKTYKIEVDHEKTLLSSTLSSLLPVSAAGYMLKQVLPNGEYRFDDFDKKAVMLSSDGSKVKDIELSEIQIKNGNTVVGRIFAQQVGRTEPGIYIIEGTEGVKKDSFKVGVDVPSGVTICFLESIPARFSGSVQYKIGKEYHPRFDLIISENDTGINTGKCECGGGSGGSEYVLPEATTDALGGVKILEYQACDTPGAFMLYGDTSYSGITTDDDGYAKLVHLTKVLTQAEYDAQGYINPDTIFFITD